MTAPATVSCAAARYPAGRENDKKARDTAWVRWKDILKGI